MERRIAVVVLLATALLALVSVSSALDAVTLNAAGATAPQALLATGSNGKQSWISSFQSLTNNQVTIKYNGTGSDFGERQLLLATLDFAVADSPLTDEEEEALSSPILHIPITLSALEFTYNLPTQMQGPLNLTADVLAKVFTLQITNWNDSAIRQFNPGLTYSGPITVVVRSDGSGSTFVLSQFLAATSNFWPFGEGRVINWTQPVTSAIGSSGVATAVANTVGAIGYVQWGVASDFTLPTAMVKNSAGYWTKPSQQSVMAALMDHSPDFGGAGLPAAGDSWDGFTLVNEAGHATYPLVTFSYALVYQNMIAMSSKGAALANFLQYLNQATTQALATGFNFVPLPPFVLQANTKSLQLIQLAPGYSPYDYYNPYAHKSGNRTAGILSLILSLLLMLGLFGLVAKGVHERFGQDTQRGIY